MLQFPDGDVYAGLSGLELEMDEFELGEGLILRRTYAHLMAPFLMAFSPAQPGKPHLGTWKAAHGGFGFDLAAELLVPKRVEASLSERIEVMRLVVALMRFWATPSITSPVMSNMSFSIAEQAPDDETHFLPLEIEPRYFRLVAPKGNTLNEARLLWVKEHWRNAVSLVGKHAELRLAVDALDEGQFIENPALALLSLWGALEALFSPAKVELRFRVAALIASYLREAGPARQEFHKKVLRLYDQRSAAAHGQPKQDPDGLLQTFELLRQVVLRILSEHHVPSKEELEGFLFGVGKTSTGESTKNGPEQTPQSGAAAT
jgi:hypothetical protein